MTVVTLALFLAVLSPVNARGEHMDKTMQYLYLCLMEIVEKGGKNYIFSNIYGRFQSNLLFLNHPIKHCFLF